MTLSFSSCSQTSKTRVEPGKSLPLHQQEIHPPQLDILFYDFVLDFDGRYTKEELFPFPSVLEDLRKDWEETWLAQEDDPFAIWVKSSHLQSGLISAYTEDFDGDGKEETFFTFGLGGGMWPTIGLYFMDSKGQVTLLDQAAFFYTELARYPGEIQLVYTSAGGAMGISQYGRIYGCKNGKALKLLYTDNGSAFYKDGCFMCATPRVGSAGSVRVTCSYWDAQAFCYRDVPYVEVDPKDLSNAVIQFAMEKGRQLEGTLCRSASVAGRYFFLEFDCSEKYNTVCLCRLLETEQVQAISNDFWYSLEYLLHDPDEAPVEDYWQAMYGVLPVQEMQEVPEEEQEQAIQSFIKQTDPQILDGIEKDTIQVRYVHYDGELYYHIVCEGKYSWQEYLLSKEFDRMQAIYHDSDG